VRQLADRERVPVLIHLAETQDEVKVAAEQHKATPVGFLDSIGFFGPQTLAAHVVHVSPKDIDILKARGVGVSHNPESNMKLASGTAPVPTLRRAGVPVGLGTDGAASNNDLDMFESMRQAALLHKLQSNDPRTLPAADVLAMATREGAAALGMDKMIGSLAPGKRADLIVVSMSSARQTPMYDPLSHLVYATRGDDVRTTIVNGRVLMRDRRVLTLDEPTVLAEARQLAAGVRQAVGK
jgi:5-methylthioadenosine/S-adenosylhomocysteine deaminase